MAAVDDTNSSSRSTPEGYLHHRHRNTRWRTFRRQRIPFDLARRCGCLCIRPEFGQRFALGQPTYRGHCRSDDSRYWPDYGDGADTDRAVRGSGWQGRLIDERRKPRSWRSRLAYREHGDGCFTPHRTIADRQRNDNRNCACKPAFGHVTIPIGTRW